VYTLIAVATIQKKVSRGRTYWQIVESRRVNGKPRPIVLQHLGSAEKLLQRLRESPTQPVKAQVIQFGALAALWQIAQELGVVGLIDAQVRIPVKKATHSGNKKPPGSGPTLHQPV
jgi:hypothetical protein